MSPTEEAVTIASAFGIDASAPVTLGDSNNVVVWLRPSAVVAKIATGNIRRPGLELSVARHLVSCGAPVVGPARELPERVHRGGRFEATFWAYQPHRRGKPAAGELARALRQLHSALLGYEGPLPSYRDGLDAVAGLLADEASAPLLAARDRVALCLALERFRADLASSGFDERALHGGPHSGNALATANGVRFIDFETACTGPIEWDLAHLSDAAVRAYGGGFDERALLLCRALISVKTAASCWSRYQDPNLRWHARHHLRLVRQLLAGRRRTARQPPV